MNSHQFQTSSDCDQQLAEDIAQHLSEIINKRGRANIAVSGGSTPRNVFHQLSLIPIAWEKVLITLVDERWVAPEDQASNERLVRDTLLCNEARTAFFLPLKNSSASPIDGYMQTENRLHELVDQLDIAILGMGADGHTASWFPNSRELDQCLDPENRSWCLPVAASDANGMPRMTLTWNCLRHCQRLFLHFHGTVKGDVLAAAERSNDVNQYPVSAVLQQTIVPVDVYRSL